MYNIFSFISSKWLVGRRAHCPQRAGVRAARRGARRHGRGARCLRRGARARRPARARSRRARRAGHATFALVHRHPTYHFGAYT